MSYSLNEQLIQRIILETSPSAQHAEKSGSSLGFGLIHYSIVRALQITSSLIIGSQRGFVPICQAIAMKDAATDGRIVFVDPGYSDAEDGFVHGMGGVGFWKNKEGVRKLFESFGVERIITHKRITSQEFFDLSKQDKHSDSFHLVYIDADHSYDGFRHDFNLAFSVLARDGLVMFHDSLVTESSMPGLGQYFGVFDYLENEGKRLYADIEVLTLPVMPGLGFARRSYPHKRGVMERNYLIGRPGSDSQAAITKSIRHHWRKIVRRAVRWI
jgi:hypothetical protein